ncbi:hypothetical protein Pan258_01990 [Symmachiella dynata]|uniref:hypothetical protein n=1 Tax=Symmachiella dynata TaxID=2527995 RepID=UPI00118B2F9A|nr:hypothetical protein [Symmachiella dynata]QDT46182.1 hypothetical protein Pan258_01990 [Symmachiella dynata]
MSNRKKPRHKEVIAFIKVVRDSFHDASIVYTFGGCYGFHLILKHVFPSAIPYLTEEKNHIVSRIDGRYYDIYGEWINAVGDLNGKVTKLSAKQKERWEAVASGQRLEYMVRKYNQE